MSVTNTFPGYAPIQAFRPDKLTADLAIEAPVWHAEASEEVSTASLVDLKALNARWIAQPMGFRQAVAMLVLVNQQFTLRGIAPAWRGLPWDVKTTPGGGPRLSMTGEMLLGESEKKRQLLRWIDLEWLRSDLGPKHRTRWKSWDPMFCGDDSTAMRVIHRIAAARWRSSEIKAPTRWKTLNALQVPPPHRRALNGLRDRDAAGIAATIRKRLQGRIEPRLMALLDDPRQRLTPELIRKRLLHAEAIELATGSPTEAARFYRWMTGEVISRASMHEMKTKIAKQCELTTRAWRGQG